jgi:hypothetical protein
MENVVSLNPPPPDGEAHEDTGTSTMVPFGPLPLSLVEARRAARASEEPDPSHTPEKMDSIIPATPLTAARAELAACIDHLAAAQRECEVAAGPANRLQQVVNQLAAAETELSALRGDDERVLGQWLIAGAEDTRPQASPATLEAEKRLAQLAHDGAAARQALPESAPISVGGASYQAYRENGETGAWIVRVPRHHMVYLTERGAGFWRKET